MREAAAPPTTDPAAEPAGTVLVAEVPGPTVQGERPSIGRQVVDTTLVVTGGEPFLQQAALTPLVAAQRDAGRRVETETNGPVAQATDLVTTAAVFNVSPKLAHAGDPVERRIVPATLTAFAATGTAVFTFVARDVVDLEEVAALVDRFGLAPVWVMPEASCCGDSRTRCRARLHLSARLHVLI